MKLATLVEHHLTDLAKADQEVTYSESAVGVLISAERARQEIEAHGASWSEFLTDEFGYALYAFHMPGETSTETATFEARDVLTWLGY